MVSMMRLMAGLENGKGRMSRGAMEVRVQKCEIDGPHPPGRNNAAHGLAEDASRGARRWRSLHSGKQICPELPNIEPEFDNAKRPFRVYWPEVPPVHHLP